LLARILTLLKGTLYSPILQLVIFTFPSPLTFHPLLPGRLYAKSPEG